MQSHYVDSLSIRFYLLIAFQFGNKLYCQLYCHHVSPPLKFRSCCLYLSISKELGKALGEGSNRSDGSCSQRPPKKGKRYESYNAQLCCESDKSSWRRSHFHTEAALPLPLYSLSILRLRQYRPSSSKSMPSCIIPVADHARVRHTAAHFAVCCRITSKLSIFPVFRCL